MARTGIRVEPLPAWSGGASAPVSEMLIPWVLPGFSVWSAGFMAVSAGLVFGLVMGGMYLFRQNFLYPKDPGGEEE